MQNTVQLMSSYPPPGPGGVGRRIEEAVELIEMELRHAVAYMNDAVVPQVRKESISAMRAMAETLTIGLILAGGLARRMGGGDKALKPLAGRPILAHVIARLRGQCDDLLLNANGDPARLSVFGLPVVADSVPDFAGPLAGILAGLDWIADHQPETEWLLSVAAACRVRDCSVPTVRPPAPACTSRRKISRRRTWANALRAVMASNDFMIPELWK